MARLLATMATTTRTSISVKPAVRCIGVSTNEGRADRSPSRRPLAIAETREFVDNPVEARRPRWVLRLGAASGYTAQVADSSKGPTMNKDEVTQRLVSHGVLPTAQRVEPGRRGYRRPDVVAAAR